MGNATTYTLVEHWNGTNWQVIHSPNPVSAFVFLIGVTAVSAQDVWAVGDYLDNTTIWSTLIEHWDGTSWQIVASPNVQPGKFDNFLHSVTAISAQDGWAVGEDSPSINGPYMALTEVYF